MRIYNLKLFGEWSSEDLCSLYSKPCQTLFTCPHALTRTEVSNVYSVVVNRITQLDIHHGGPSLGVCVKLPNLVSEMQWCHCNKTSYESVVDNSNMFFIIFVVPAI